MELVTNLKSGMRLWGLVALLCLMGLGASAQDRKVVFSNFVVKENVVEDSRTGVKGLLLQFDASFNWQEKEFFDHQFQVKYRMEQQGRVVLEEGDVSGYKSSLSTYDATVKGKPGMLSKGYKIFIPYVEIPFESGLQQVEMVFSLSNDQGTYTDCHRQAVQFTHNKVKLRTKNEQEFTFGNFVWDWNSTAWGSDKPGMRFTCRVDFKYAPAECADDYYEFYWVLNNTAGKQIYDSRSAGGSAENSKKLTPTLVDGKSTCDFSMFADYYSVDMEGPGEAEVVFILLGAEGGPKKVFSQRMMLQVPQRYNFESQEFTLEQVVVQPSTADGVKGVSVDYRCAFKYAGVMRNYEMGKYHFYLALLDQNNKVVVAPERAPTQGAGTTHLQDGQLPSASNTVASGHLFIPLHLLNLPAGGHDLKYALMVSDVNLRTKFPVLGTGKVHVDRPATRRYKISVETLQMIDANYDSEVIPISSRLPELQYSLRVGEDNYYVSEYERNSLSGIPGEAVLQLCEGDPVQFVLYDVDSGFFNNSDMLGRWAIAYAGKGDSFVYEVANSGQVVSLRIRISKVN